MIPLRDLNPIRTTPFVNYLIIALNVLMFMWELSYGPETEQFLYNVAFIPARFWIPGYLVPNLITIFISMFLHGGFLHIAGNMLYLWIFGDNVEDRLGHARYLFFYLTCGLLATLAHAMMNPESRVPSIGASGAIAGVLGAYIILFPKQRVTTLIPIFIFITVREIPAIFLLGFWILMQIFFGAASMNAGDLQSAGGVAYFAHIGGFVAGMLLVVLLGGLRRPTRVVYSDDRWR